MKLIKCIKVNLKSVLTMCLMILAMIISAQEICNNGIDDDNDGLIDLNDDECTCANIEPLTGKSGTPCRILSLSFDIPGATDFQWYKDGIAVPGYTFHTIDIQRFAPTGEGTYQAVAVAPDGKCITSVPEEVIRDTYETDLGNIFLCDGDTLFLNGFYFFKPGLDMFTIKTVEFGCDSTVLFKIFHDPLSEVLNETLCTGSTYVNGNIAETESGRYMDTLRTARGCDSLIRTVNLTVSEPNVNLELETTVACAQGDTIFLYGGFPIGGVYSGPGVEGSQFIPAAAGVGVHTITYSYTDANGCRSSAYDEIEVTLPKPDEVTNVSVCQEELPYYFRAQEYSGSGTYYYTEVDQNGCSYNHILNLTVNPVTPDILTVLTIAEPELPFVWNGLEIWNAGTYTHQVVDWRGCSYEVVLELTVLTAFAKAQFYYDENQNGEKDIEENYFSIGAVKVNQEKIYNNFRPEGIYLTAEQGPLKIEYHEALSPDWYVTSQEAFEYEVDSEDFEATVEFGLYPYTIESALDSYLDGDRFRCGEYVDFVFSAVNYGTSIESGAIYLELDYRIEEYSFSVPPTFEDNGIVGWELDELYPSEKMDIAFTIRAPLITDPNQVGELYRFRHGLTVDLSGATDHDIELRCSYDPNDKQVSPSREDNLALTGTPLFYKIRFQNTGNDYARDVSVVDTLDENLDLTTFKLIDTSHPDELAVSFDDGQTVTFDFKNIYLQDSISNEPESHGFITYTIAPKEDVALETNIRNTAYIYFDFNPAIITNTTESIMVDAFPVSSTTAIDKLDVTIYPNPVQNQVNVVVEIPLDLSITDQLGQQILKTQLKAGNNTFRTTAWNSGIYILQFSDARRSWSELLVIED